MLVAGVPTPPRGWLAESLAYLSSSAWQFLPDRNTVHLCPVHTDKLYVCLLKGRPSTGSPLGVFFGAWT